MLLDPIIVNVIGLVTSNENNKLNELLFQYGLTYNHLLNYIGYMLFLNKSCLERK